MNTLKLSIAKKQNLSVPDETDEEKLREWLDRNIDSDLIESDIDCIPDSALPEETPARSTRVKLDSSGLNINTDYPCSSGNYTKCTSREITHIVVHYTGGTGTALQNVKYYAGSPEREASAHLFVGNASENAQIYLSVDLVDKAWHCGSKNGYYCEARNSNSIGIEVACHNDTSDKSANSTDWYFDDVTVDKLVQIVKYLMEKYGIDADHVVRHYDVTHKTCPAMWVHNLAAWTAFKARLTADDTATLVSSVAAKIGLSASSYWTSALKGLTVAKSDYIQALLGKVCSAKGKTYSYANADAILSLNSDDYWQAVLTGTKTASAATLTALFTKIDTVL